MINNIYKQETTIKLDSIKHIKEKIGMGPGYIFYLINDINKLKKSMGEMHKAEQYDARSIIGHLISEKYDELGEGYDKHNLNEDEVFWFEVIDDYHYYRFKDTQHVLDTMEAKLCKD